MKKLILLFPILFCFFSCIENDYNPALLKPDATKKFGEILVVTKKKNWHNELGQTLRANFGQLVNTTPLPYEKEFNLLLLSERNSLVTLILFSEIFPANLMSLPIFPPTPKPHAPIIFLFFKKK